MIVKVWLAPELTDTAPLGVIDPLEPALAVTVKVSMAKVAAMVWLAVTFEKVYEATAPTEVPSTVTFATW